jgi:hypothetical protein
MQQYKYVYQIKIIAVIITQTTINNNYHKIKLLKHRAHKHHNHKINCTSTTQYFVDEMENILNTSKGKTTLRQPNPKNNYNKEDLEYRHKETYNLFVTPRLCMTTSNLLASKLDNFLQVPFLTDILVDSLWLNDVYGMV